MIGCVCFKTAGATVAPAALFSQRSGLIRCWFFLFLLLSGSALAAPQWKVLETPRFTVVSQISEKETRAWAEEFNQFIESLAGLVKIEDKFLPKLTIVIFSRNKDFSAYKPIGENGKVQDWVAGYFSRQESWSVIGMAEHLEDESMRRLIYHEGVHWLVSADQQAYPMWYNEGLAELFSTFELEKGQAVFGKAINSHVGLLREEKPLPLERLLLVSASDRLFNESDRTGIFYAQSWAFVHYLIFGQRTEKRGTLGEFLNEFYGKDSVEVAFKKSFGMDYAAMDKALRQYLREGKYFISKRPLPPKAKITAPFQPATPAAVEVALARLAFGSRHLEKATQHAREAVRLDPNHAPGYTMLAWALRRGEDTDLFLEAAEKAVQLGATDPEALDLLAQAKFQKARSLGGVPPQEARQIVDLLERAIDALPSLKYAYINLVTLLSSVDKLKETDLRYVAQGRRLFPDDMSIIIGWIHVLHNQGAKGEALKLVEKVLTMPEKLQAEQLKNLREMKSYFDAQDTQDKVNSMMEQERYKEAVEMLDALLVRSPTLEARGQISMQRKYALAQMVMQEADLDFNAGRVDAAVSKYERVLAMNALPPWMRERLISTLQRLKGGAAPADSSGQ